MIVDRRGRSIADSQPTTPTERSFGTRPEVAAALRGQTVSGIRRSRTLGTGLLYVAVPVASSGVVHGAVRVTYPTSTLDARVNRYRFALLGVGIVVLLAAAALGLLLARSFARPLRSLERVAARVGEGDLEARASERAGPPEIRRLAGELNRTTAKLSSLLGSQEQFVTDASHELRTPLTALRLRLENGDTDAALREADRLGRLVDELLALARADAPGAPATDVDLAEVAVRRVEQWEPLAAEYGVRLSASGDGGVVHAGGARVEQVLDNLLSNAIDASPRDAQIVVAVRGSELHVIDEGPGLTAEQRARAFDRFWRASNEPGSGLGLAIAKRLVELDDGEIELRAAAGGGVDAVVRYRARQRCRPDRVLCSVPVATMTRAHAGFTGVVQHEWLRPRGWVAPQRVAALGIDTLPGVGAALAKRLRALGIETVLDLLQHRPRRYELAVDEVAISQLWGDEEVAIAGVVQDVRTRRLGGRRTIVTARIKDASGMIGASWFNQPWLAEKLTPGTHLRLRGKLGRYGFDVKSYDVGEAQATADFAPVYPASEQVPSTKLRELVRVALAQVGRYLPDALPAELDEPLACDAIAAIHFPRDEAEAEAARRQAGARRALHAAARRCALTGRGRCRDCVARAGCARRPVSRRAAVRADRAPGARDRGDRPRPRAHDTDAASVAG